MAKTHPYYSYNKVLSCNGTYNFIVGGRGLGKTYGIKVKAIKDWLRKGEQFIYVRRYTKELAKARATFFADVAYLFPKHVFRIHGDQAQISNRDTDPKAKNAWVTIGYFVALSSGQYQKSVSYPRVTKIIFDEFIIEKGKIPYLPEETTTFNNLYSTVDRWQDKTKVFFLANSVSITNPYFLQYEIEPDKADEAGLIRKLDNFIVCHFPDSKLFSNSVFETKFGKFIKESDEEYAEYAVGNQFADNNNGLISPKDPKSRYYYTLETPKGTFSVWKNMFTGEWTIQEKRPKSEILFTLLPEKMTEEKKLLVHSDKILSQLRTGFRSGKVTFDKPPTRNALLEVFKR